MRTFVEAHCIACHDEGSRKGGLDLDTLRFDPADPENFAAWAKVRERITNGEMPPPKRDRPPAAETSAVSEWLHRSLVEADLGRLRREGGGRTPTRRLTRGEYENTVRDLLDLPGIPLQGGLPADGSAHGFDKNDDALDISHVNMAKYVEAADLALDMAIATFPEPPTSRVRRLSLARNVGHILGNGDAVLLRDKKPDPEYPPAGNQSHLDQGAHERMGSFDRGSSVGVFRHEGESFSPYFLDFAAIYAGRYRLRASFWSFQWDKGEVLPSRGIEAARLSAVQLNDDGRGGGHPSYPLGYFDAPSLEPEIHEFVAWLNPKETIGFNTASLAPVVNYNRPGRALAFTGPGIASDWLEIEGPIHDTWPPKGHRMLFGSLPIVEFKAEEHAGVRPPARKPARQPIGHATNQPDPAQGIWTVATEHPSADADRLLANFLPRAFRRPVGPDVRREYVEKVEARLRAGDCFEAAMRWGYRAALCSPDFLLLVEPPDKLDDFALACRLSYFLRDSLPDERLAGLAESGSLGDRATLDAEVLRLLAGETSGRFLDDFLGQWLKLRQISANDPDGTLYPEFSPYLQHAMVAETRAYLRELIEKDLDASYLVKSDFAMLNERLAVHYGITGVHGSKIRRVALPPGSSRGGFLTQAAILKVTSNGTTTSPVPRGAFMMARLLGQPPPPPPPNIPAVEPDVRGATTIREQLDRHRADASCASCHAKIDPPGFALESFDVIGGWRDRYRSIGTGDPAPRGSLDPFLNVGFKLGPPVDPSGNLPDGRKFAGIAEFQALLAADPNQLLKNLAKQLAVYSTGRDLAYSDGEEIDRIVARTKAKGGGIRTLIRELIASDLFQTR